MMQQNAISLWDASAKEQDNHAPLEQDSTVDVAIVGGGFTDFRLHCIALTRGFPRMFLRLSKSALAGRVAIAGW